MKKLILAALICAPLFFQAQTRPASPMTAAKEPAKEPGEGLRYNVETLFCELIVAETQNKMTIRVDIGKDLMANLTDKESIAQIEQLRSIQFTSVADALNFMGNGGWKMGNSYLLNRATTTETHIVMEKRLARKPGGDAQGGIRPPVDRPAGEPAARPADPSARPSEPGVRPVPPANPKEKGKG